jgi:hypothetical protein
MFMSFHLLKTCITNSSLFFFTVPPDLAHERNDDDNPDWHTYISLWGGEFCLVSIFAKLVCQSVGG